MAKIYFFKKVSEMILTEERAKTIQESTVYDVAKAFLHLESMTPKKLQKLCYYAYSFYLAIYEKKLFDDNFEAWVHGPVILNCILNIENMAGKRYHRKSIIQILL
ncbi:Panacea domain-containing protein [Paenibacillus larvae]|uniref:Panacea domain-containing protein n=1 Tax=Paenibacillus larvae TaxID=1464 RepID=UPI0030140363